VSTFPDIIASSDSIGKNAKIPTDRKSKWQYRRTVVSNSSTETL